MKDNQPQQTSMEDRILEQARKLFLEVGYALTSTTEIARRVGCNQSMVHYYFRTKEQLFLKVFMQMKRLLADSLSSTLDCDKKDVFGHIEGIIDVHFSMLEANPCLPFLVMGQVMTNTQRRTELIEDFRATVLSISEHLQCDLDLAYERGEIIKCNSAEILTNIVSLNVGTFLIKPLLCDSMQMGTKEWEGYLVQRKTEIVKCILNSIKP